MLDISCFICFIVKFDFGVSFLENLWIVWAHETKHRHSKPAGDFRLSHTQTSWEAVDNLSLQDDPTMAQWSGSACENVNHAQFAYSLWVACISWQQFVIIAAVFRFDAWWPVLQTPRRVWVWADASLAPAERTRSKLDAASTGRLRREVSKRSMAFYCRADSTSLCWLDERRPNLR